MRLLVFQSLKGLILTIHTIEQDIFAEHISIPQRSDFNVVATGSMEQNVEFQSLKGLILTKSYKWYVISTLVFQSLKGLILT